MAKVKRVYPIKDFSELTPQIQDEAKQAGILALVKMSNRFKGVFSSTIVNDADKAWEKVMSRIDRTYGTCTCGDKSFKQECPSFSEHALVSEFIEMMEDEGYNMANRGVNLDKDSVEESVRAVLITLKSY